MTDFIDVPSMLRDILSAIDINQAQLAKKLEVSQGTISKWLSAKAEPSLQEFLRLYRLAKKTGVDVVTLDLPEGAWSDDRISVSNVDGEQITSHSLPQHTIVEIDAYLGAGGGGFPLESQINHNSQSFVSESVKAIWNIPKIFLAELGLEAKEIGVLEINGNSMIKPNGDGLQSGDRAFFHVGNKAIKQGGVFVVRDGDELIVKQVELVRDGAVDDIVKIKCTSWNPDYEPFELVIGDDVEIIGRVGAKFARM